MARVQCSHCRGTGNTIYSSGSNKPIQCSWCLGRGHVEEPSKARIGSPEPYAGGLARAEADMLDKELEKKLWKHKPDTLHYQADGSYYTSMPIQPWEIIDAYNLNFYEGNVIKYVLRKKPGQSKVLEWQKAKHYLEHLIELETKNET